MRLASILAQVLASTTLVSTTLLACGGQTVGVAEQQPGSSSGSTGADSGTNPPEPPPPQPPTVDASVPDAAPDAACSKPPVLVRQGNVCSDVWYLPCGVPADVKPEDGMSPEECKKVCGPSTTGQYAGCSEYQLADLPGPSFECYSCVEGSRPQGYVDPAVAPTVAGWLAHAADLERVSIDAFEILGRELAHHGAPAELLERATRAAADEVRHANVLGALARREGATLGSAPVTHGPARALFDVALENAVEGCIRETYGALVAGYQAEHAGRTDMRRVMKQIYRDETAHAELAWSVHAWLVEQLTADQRARIAGAMDRAIEELALAARSTPAAELVDALGLPPPRDAQRMVSGLAAQLWAPALAA